MKSKIFYQNIQILLKQSFELIKITLVSNLLKEPIDLIVPLREQEKLKEKEFEKKEGEEINQDIDSSDFLITEGSIVDNEIGSQDSQMVDENSQIEEIQESIENSNDNYKN